MSCFDFDPESFAFKPSDLLILVLMYAFLLSMMDKGRKQLQ